MEEERRLHPAAVAVWSVEVVRRIGLGFLPLLVTGRWGRAIALGLVVAAVVSSVIRTLRFRYRLDGPTLVVRGGLLWRWRRVLPVSRIQSVDVVQRLVHRWLGVVELRVEVVGGRQTEAALVAVRPDEADALRTALLSGHREAPSAVPPLVRLGAGSLLLAGITGGRVAVFAVLLGYLQEFLPEDVVEGVFDRFGQAGLTGLAALLIGAALFLLVSLVVSIAATVVVYWDFTIARDGDRLVITRGLLQKRRAVIPISRVQAVRLEENLVRRVFGLATLTAALAGYTGQQDEQQQSGMLLPIAGRDVALAVASDLLGAPAEVLSGHLQPAPARALARRALYAGVAGLGTGIAAVIAFEAFGFLGFLALPAAAALGFLSWRALGHTVAGRHAVTRSGVLVRRTTFTALENIQHLVLSASPVQRLLRLATVRLGVARARPEAVDLDAGRAEDRFEMLGASLVTAQRRVG
jgi:putative membrane protein